MVKTFTETFQKSVTHLKRQTASLSFRAGRRLDGTKQTSFGGELNRRCVDVYSTASAIESDMAVDKSVERVIVSNAHISARMELGADLTNDDAASGNDFTAKTLYASALAVAVASVAATALAFLMCHDRILMLRVFGCRKI